MGMKVRNTSEDSSNAFKEALVMRSAGTITRPMDDMLGTIIYNIARWAVAESNPANLGDEDFISDVQLHLLMKLDKADLNRSGKALMVYFKTAADRKIVSMYRYNGRQKRTGTLVELEPRTVATDIYGRIIERN